MKINRDNYEAYFLDYYEGQLSPDMIEEVMLFVKQNPELKNIFDEFEAISLVADQDIVFDNKSSLKKNQVFATSQVNELNYEDYLIGETEGILNAEQLSAIEEFISINPQFEKERKLYALAHLPTESDILFEAKESLKKRAISTGSINIETFDSFMVRELEGDLNPNEKLQLSEFLQYNPHLERDRELFAHTILKPETDIVFGNKSILKKSVVPIRRILNYTLAAAASLALIFSIYFLLDHKNVPRNLAENGKVNSITNKTITAPINVLPENQVAPNNKLASTNNNKAIPDRKVRKSSNTIPSDYLAVNSQVQEQLAVSDHHPMETLQSRSAVKISTRSFVEPQFTFIRVSQMYTNQLLEFYYNLKLAEEIQYALVNSKDNKPGQTIFAAVTGKIEDLFTPNHKTPLGEEKKNLTLWTFAELGVQTLNTVTSSELELKLRKDEEGKVVAYSIESGLLDFEKDVKK